MDKEIFRVIPGYDKYSVTRFGLVKSNERNLILTQYCLNGYFIVDTFRGSRTETLPVHRAVALAWVDNPDPTLNIVVNHLDGDITHNHCDNLEWTTVSGNNYHAVNTGLRKDNMPCRIRDFKTGEVIRFPSMAQACNFMGLPKDTHSLVLYPKMFGKLIEGRFEFRFESDKNPWFYENRKHLVPPSRYMVVVKHEDCSQQEIYSTAALLKELQLYRAPSKSIPALVEYARRLYPSKGFILRDSYLRGVVLQKRNTRGSSVIKVIAKNDDTVLSFESLTKCARYFAVDRSSIFNRLDNGNKLDGWTFAHSPVYESKLNAI